MWSASNVFVQLTGVTAKDVTRLFEQQEKLWHSVVGEGGRGREEGGRERGWEGGGKEGGRSGGWRPVEELEKLVRECFCRKEGLVWRKHAEWVSGHDYLNVVALPAGQAINRSKHVFAGMEAL